MVQEQETTPFERNGCRGNVVRTVGAEEAAILMRDYGFDRRGMDLVPTGYDDTETSFNEVRVDDGQRKPLWTFTRFRPAHCSGLPARNTTRGGAGD